MKGIWIFVIILIIILIVIGVGIAIYIYLKKKNILCDQNIFDCNTGSLLEKKFSSTIKKPSFKLYLYELKIDNMSPYTPLCNPMWYAARYVNMKDGSYGELSDWVGPIYAGQCDSTNSGKNTNPILPCYNYSKDKGCSQDNILVGVNALYANSLKLCSVGNFDYNASDNYLINIHRKTGTLFDKKSIEPPSDAVEDIVGILLPTNIENISGIFSDVAKPPSSNNYNMCVSDKCK